MSQPNDPRKIFEQHHAEYEAGIVNREPLVIPQPPEDQSQPGPWWIVPAFAIMALAMVFAGYLIAEALP